MVLLFFFVGVFFVWQSCTEAEAKRFLVHHNSECAGCIRTTTIKCGNENVAVRIDRSSISPSISVWSVADDDDGKLDCTPLGWLHAILTSSDDVIFVESEVIFSGVTEDL